MDRDPPKWSIYVSLRSLGQENEMEMGIQVGTTRYQRQIDQGHPRGGNYEASEDILLVFSVAMPAFADEGQPTVAPIEQFTAADMHLLFEQDAQPMQVVVLSQEEMKEAERAAAPLVAIGVIKAKGFIAKRWVTQRLAQTLVQKGKVDIWAPTRAIAKNIAGRGAIMEYHAGWGRRYTHYHPAHLPPNTHVFLW